MSKIILHIQQHIKKLTLFFNYRIYFPGYFIICKQPARFHELAKESSRAVVNISTTKKVENVKPDNRRWKQNPHGFEQFEGPFGEFFKKFFEEEGRIPGNLTPPNRWDRGLLYLRMAMLLPTIML